MRYKTVNQALWEVRRGDKREETCSTSDLIFFFSSKVRIQQQSPGLASNKAQQQSKEDAEVCANVRHIKANESVWHALMYHGSVTVPVFTMVSF